VFKRGSACLRVYTSCSHVPTTPPTSPAHMSGGMGYLLWYNYHASSTVSFRRQKTFAVASPLQRFCDMIGGTWAL
jgi:hypothetical protein